jgi:hypothetical protein
MRTSQRLVEPLILMDLNNECLRGTVGRVLVCAIAFALVFNQERPVTSACQRAANETVTSNDVRLILQTSKRSYSSKEAIELTAYLENMSFDKAYYVGRALGKFFIIESFHYIELEIVDDKGRQAPIGLGAATSIWKSGATTSEKLAQEYIQLQPGMIYGQRDAGNIRLQPGHYRLRARYHESEALQWTQKERNSLPAPVWTRSLVSNSVTLRVLP